MGMRPPPTRPSVPFLQIHKKYNAAWFPVVWGTSPIPSPPRAQKNALSAIFTSPSALRARGQEGHMGLRLPSNMASFQLQPLPLWAGCQVLGEIQLRPLSPSLHVLTGQVLATDVPPRHTNQGPGQGGFWQVSRTICSSRNISGCWFH
jgi:hypothetical protein